MDNEEKKDYEEIRISLIGGTSDGKTTFLSSMLISMMNRPVNFGNGHTIMIDPVEMKKGLLKSDSKGQVHDTALDNAETAAALNNLKNNVNNSGKRNIASLMSSPQGVPGNEETHRPVTTQADKDGDINITDTGSDDAASAMLDMIEQIRDFFKFPSEGGNATFATPTGRYIVMKFNVMVDSTIRCKLVITDYAGEIVDLVKDRISENLKKSYSSQITESDGAIILANATKLSENLVENQHDDGQMFKDNPTKVSLRVDKITPVIKAAKGSKPFTIMVAISQVDNPKIDPRVSRNNFRDTERNLQKHIYAALYSWAKGHNWAVGMLPIGAFGVGANGRSNVDENNQLIKDCDPNPVGIDKSILFCLYNVSLVRDKELEDKIEEVKKNNKIAYRFRGTAPWTEIARLENIRSDYETLRKAILDEVGYFNDVYEMSYFDNPNIDVDPRFPNERRADINGVSKTGLRK